MIFIFQNTLVYMIYMLNIYYVYDAYMLYMAVLMPLMHDADIHGNFANHIFES
jgi:hypothetical protein